MLFESTCRKSRGKSGLEKSRNDAHFSCFGISQRDSFSGVFAAGSSIGTLLIPAFKLKPILTLSLKYRADDLMFGG